MLYSNCIFIIMENKITKQRIAVRAVILNDKGEVLVIRESQKYEGGTNRGLYEFPGGKIEVGETFQDALNRETKEEIGIDIEIGDPFHVGEWRPVVRGEQLQIIGIFFKCKALDLNIKLSNDHDDYRWVTTKEALSLPLMKEAESVIMKLL